jgi:4-hydroxy-3-methylbut-2-enyl diphosphate reductase
MLDAVSSFDTNECGPAVGEPLPRVRVTLASPRGFCAGVRRAIDAVTDALEHHGAPVYVRRPIVHNRAVVASLEAKGAVFVEELDDVPEGAVVILSAHGVAPDVAADAKRRKLVTYDAVCPLVAKVHHEVKRHHRSGRHVILVGHEGHPEIVGTLGHIPPAAASLVRDAGDVSELDLAEGRAVGYAVQTTYSVEEAGEVVAAIHSRFPHAVGPPSSDICYATTNRQAAVREIAPQVDAMIVVGEQFSSNASRLAEVAEAAGCASVQLVADRSALDWGALHSRSSIGITAAASTPEGAVAGVIEALRSRYSLEIDEVGGAAESTVFKPVRIG